MPTNALVRRCLLNAQRWILFPRKRTKVSEFTVGDASLPRGENGELPVNEWLNGEFSSLPDKVWKDMIFIEKETNKDNE